MQVFLSYRRSETSWVARAVRQALELRGADVFMDVEDIDSGRFENVILNQIGLREHFVVLLNVRTARSLGDQRDWVARELARAIELGKNVVPVLIDGATTDDIASAFPRRAELLELNFAQLRQDLFDQSITVLVDRFLKAPSLQELRIRTAEEHFQAGAALAEREDWAAAEHEYGEAIARRPRAEYFLGRGLARYQQDRRVEALTDLDAAIALDPFAFELMDPKFMLLQEMDRLQEALNLVGQWKSQAHERAVGFARRIVARLDSGEDVVTAVRSVPELRSLYGEPMLGEPAEAALHQEIGASLETLLEHVGEDLQVRLRAELEAWKKNAPSPLAPDQSPPTREGQ